MLENVSCHVFTTKVCPNCKLLKQWLVDNRIPYAEHDLADPEVIAFLRSEDIHVLVAPILLTSDNIYIDSDFLYRGNIDSEKLYRFLGVTK